MSDLSGTYFDSSWSDAESVLYVESNQQISSMANQRQLEEEKKFTKSVLRKWGTLGLVVYHRSKKLNFDRRLLIGQSKHTMHKFSLGVNLNHIERELGKALFSCFSKSGTEKPPTREIYFCLKMIDKILPQDLTKMMNQVTNKYFP